MVDSGKKKTFIGKLLFVFKPKRSTDIVAYAEKIIDDYTGVTDMRLRAAKRRKKKLSLIFKSLLLFSLPCIIWCFFKIFF